ncbi:hypothetical protein [Streptomyces vietnamensis]|uniref:Uncharacterized protein n=1 Tax=Streptomyces vietnamensis TaxID=362257 RepID=A0A0B5IE89_9ACTN|nr:hypothetical protein [Streptomyces vietnamensis]AJF68832.1 hypothetical protein SVTN_35445 [Streptomyces vietnamensis]
MRMLLKVELDTQASNEAIKQGRLLKLMEGTVEELDAEAAYFTVENGCRTCYIFFDMADPSLMPKISAPFFMEAGAKVYYSPVMNAEDLRKGISAITPS